MDLQTIAIYAHASEKEKVMRTKLWTFVLAVAILGLVMGGISLSLKSASTSAVASSGETTHLRFPVKFIGQANCTLTFSLPGGDITTQFLNIPPPAKTFAVTGGTGT